MESRNKMGSPPSSPELEIIAHYAPLPQPLIIDDDDLFESDTDDDLFDTVILSDDDKDDEQPPVNNASMICHRCPIEEGRFRNYNKFRFHVKRHLHGDHFSCSTCQRPFIKLSHCISHELRVHDLDISQVPPSDRNSRVVKLAREYVEKKREQQQVPVVEQDVDSDGEETDPEDITFYDNHVVASNGLVRFRGLETRHFLETFEIYVNHGRRKWKSLDEIARGALKNHRWNVENDQDYHRLGRFSKRKAKAPEVKFPLYLKFKDRPPPADAINPQTNEKRSKKKRKVVETDGDNSNDFVPAKKPKIVANDNFKKGILKSSWSAKKCQKCSYQWVTKEELENHRVAMHATCQLNDLIMESGKSKKVTFEEEQDSDDDLFVPIKTVRRKSKSLVSNNTSSLVLPTGGLFHRPKVPLVDDTFTEKEKFLYSIGLVQSVRLEIQKERSEVSATRPCKVSLRRLSQAEYLFYTTSSFAFGHFLFS